MFGLDWSICMKVGTSISLAVLTLAGVGAVFAPPLVAGAPLVAAPPRVAAPPEE